MDDLGGGLYPDFKNCVTLVKSSRFLGFSYPNAKPRCWGVMSFYMQFGNRLEGTKYF